MLDPILAADGRGQIPVIGWREYLSLPDLGIACIKGKIDTGARTSAIHAFDVEIFQEGEQEKVRFKVHPTQGHSSDEVTAEAILLEHRQVKNSGGQAELRPVISTALER
ncbi:MAG: hypothetical protein HC810_02210 [Acaryochloridaceae cyanobacterium RL_2_7]|nr:hypothetical protein [Acaryochloridaceae cyanobacterium RL_2_7]